jgi:hypothetical protein
MVKKGAVLVPRTYMPPAYAPKEAGKKVFVLWQNRELMGGLFGWTWESKVIPVGDVVKARLFGSVEPAELTTCQISVNNYVVWSEFRIIREVIPVDIDVTPYIAPYSDNVIAIGVSTLGAGMFTLSLEIEYQETAPQKPKTPLSVWDYLLYGGLIIGGVFAVGYLVHSLRKK